MAIQDLRFFGNAIPALKLYIKSKEYAQKAVAINSKIKEPAQRNVTMGMMLQEMAYYEISLKNYQSAITNIKKHSVFSMMRRQKGLILRGTTTSFWATAIIL